MPTEIPNKGIRFFVGCLIAVTTFYSLQSILLVPKFEELFNTMLAGRPLPPSTRLMLALHPWTAVAPASVFIVAALVLKFSTKEHLPFYCAGACLLISILIAMLTFTGLYLPLVSIVTSMNEGLN